MKDALDSYRKAAEVYERGWTEHVNKHGGPTLFIPGPQLANHHEAGVRAVWNAAIEACREICIEVNGNALEAAKAKDATDYVAGYRDAAIDCDEAIRALAK